MDSKNEEKILADIIETKQKLCTEGTLKRNYLLINKNNMSLDTYYDWCIQARDCLFSTEWLPFEVTVDFPSDSMARLREYAKGLLNVYEEEMKLFSKFRQEAEQSKKEALFLTDYVENDDYETWSFNDNKHIFIYGFDIKDIKSFKVSDTIYAHDDEKEDSSDRYSVYIPSIRFIAIVGLDLPAKLKKFHYKNY